jgi:hypothetical protein
MRSQISEGNTTTNSQDYDQGGNEVGEPTRQIDEEDPYKSDDDKDDDNRDDNTTDESGSSGGSGGAGGEMPADDGTDETPRRRLQSPGDLSFSAIAIASQGPGLAAHHPSVDTGDPAASVAADVDDDAGGGESSVGMGDWRESPVDVAAFVDAPQDDDPNLNPRALVAVAAATFGPEATKTLERLL